MICYSLFEVDLYFYIHEFVSIKINNVIFGTAFAIIISLLIIIKKNIKLWYFKKILK